MANDSHKVQRRERSGPTGEYVICSDCGRTANTEKLLEGRPCKDGISVKESLRNYNA